MPVSDKQKKFAREWDKENMRTVSCRLRTYQADDFKLYCTMQGTTPGAINKEFVLSCLDEDFYKKLDDLNREKNDEFIR